MNSDPNSTGRLPTLHVVAESIPQAYFRAMKAVWEQGLAIRTQYDRKDAAGRHIDPPSRDARVLIEVLNPFAEPRFPPVSFCEIGTYIAEFMGVKDHLVLPIDRLKQALGGDLDATQWPYTYHQRLFAHPDLDGSTVNQIELMLDRVAQTPFTRRGVATTSVPNLDPFLKEDVPCLREIQLRCPQDAQGRLVANLSTAWRSRDLYKAWPDNVIGITFLQQWLAGQIQNRTGQPCRVGSYADYSFSLHIYGQDHAAVGGDSGRGLASFFDNFDEQTILDRSMTSADARDALIVPQLRELLSSRQISQWGFPQASVDILENLLRDM